MTPRAPRETTTEKTEIVLPQHANAIGTAFGGTVMSWIDICAAVSAQRHCSRVAVTASVDALDFVAPLRVGDVVVLRSWVNAAFRTSLEVECVVEREDTSTGARVLCADAKLTFVNLGPDGRPQPVPALAPETDEERAREAAAIARRETRLAARR
ncbi:MAG: acyl-CoA thioesterase [Polyangiales bacterium]